MLDLWRYSRSLWAKQEADIVTVTEPRDNPSSSVVVVRYMAGESRKIDKTGKTQRKRKLKQDAEQYKEEEVKQALRQGKSWFRIKRVDSHNYSVRKLWASNRLEVRLFVSLHLLLTVTFYTPS